MKKSPILLATSLAAALMLTGCNSSDSDSYADIESNGSSNNIQTVHIDASSNTQPVHFSFSQGKTVNETDDWDIRFIRDSITVNATKKTAIADKQEAFYDGGDPSDIRQPVASGGQQFVNATDATMLPSLFNAISILDNTWYDPNTIKPAIDGGWYIPGHPLAPKAQDYIIRSNKGDSYARFNVDSITFSNGAYDVVFNFYIQQTGSNTFSATAAQWTVTSGNEACYDFDQSAEVVCNDAAWDVKFGADRMMTLYTNGGDSGTGNAGVYKVLTGENYAGGGFDGTAGLPPQSYSQDVFDSAFVRFNWAAYNPLGLNFSNPESHQLWSNYRVYVVDTDPSDTTVEPYKMQITDYYNAAGTAGHYTLRYAVLSATQ